MNRKIMVVVVGLLALGALEFGLLGASAAGLVGGSGHALPPIPQRGIVLDTPTLPPAVTVTPSVPGAASKASIELLRPDPAAITCDGSQSSTITVVVRDDFGNLVPDNTGVGFLVINGSAARYKSFTTQGSASNSVVIYSDAYSQQPNVVVRSSDMETAVRVRCIPNSGCPLSPPPNASPPCGSPTPTPRPCNPSPGSVLFSPPCASPTPPPCNPSPGSGNVSPPCPTATPSPCKGNVSPPCATPTPVPCNPSPGVGNVSPPCVPPTPTPTANPCVIVSPSPPSTSGDCPFAMALDADRTHIGIQTTRRVVGNEPFQIGIDVTKATAPYEGYQWLIESPSGLAFDSATENTSATGMDLCSNPADTSGSPQTIAIYAGCLSAVGVKSFLGETTAITLHCAAIGSFAVRLVPLGEGPLHTSVLEPGGNEVPTTTTGITVDCRSSGDVCADVTGDGRVTQRDVAFIVANIFKRRPDLRADVDGDGRVTFADEQIAIQQLGRRC